MPYALYHKNTGEILSVSKNRIPNNDLPKGYKSKPFDGTAEDAKGKRFDGAGNIVGKTESIVAGEQQSEDWERLRQRRWALLSRSDWTQLADAPAKSKPDWAVYRQKLRDLPQNTTDPQNPIWPEAPE